MFKARELAKAPRAEGALLDWLAAVTASDIDDVKRGIEPLAQAGKVGALLAQFPASFKHSAETIDYLDGLLEQSLFGEVDRERDRVATDGRRA